jgi:hypothetical protein
MDRRFGWTLNPVRRDDMQKITSSVGNRITVAHPLTPLLGHPDSGIPGAVHTYQYSNTAVIRKQKRDSNCQLLTDNRVIKQ